MGETIEIEVPDESTALEVGYAIYGRAVDLHEDPNPDNEEMAVRLRDLSQEITDEYEG